MALSTTVQTETTVVIRESAATHVSTNDVFGGPKRLTHVRIHNASAQRVFVKLYDALDVDESSLPVPLMILSMPANTDRARPVGNGGYSFTTGVTLRCVREAGDAGSTAPSSSVIVDLTGE